MRGEFYIPENIKIVNLNDTRPVIEKKWVRDDPFNTSFIYNNNKKSWEAYYKGSEQGVVILPLNTKEHAVILAILNSSVENAVKKARLVDHLNIAKPLREFNPRFATFEHDLIGQEINEKFVEMFNKDLETQQLFQELKKSDYLVEEKDKPIKLKIFPSLHPVDKTAEKTTPPQVYQEFTLYTRDAAHTEHLTIGNIIALAGDFYGVIDSPISIDIDGKSGSREITKDSEKETRFKNAYDKLAWAKKENIQANLTKIKDEFVNLTKKINEENPVDTKKIEINSAIDKNINLEVLEDFSSQEHRSAIISTVLRFYNENTRNLFYLLKNNFDHFGDQAREAYRAGHRLALKLAAIAGQLKKSNSDLSNKFLMQAFTIELFACHFLTDLFSSGHQRTPRKELYDYLKEKGGKKIPFKNAFAGMMANVMHDEDNENGVVLENGNGMVWSAYGDYYYKTDKNHANRYRISCAVTKALSGIFTLYAASLNQTNNANKDMFNRQVAEMEKEIPHISNKVGANKAPLFNFNSNMQLEMRNKDPNKKADVCSDGFGINKIMRTAMMFFGGTQTETSTTSSQNEVKTIRDKLNQQAHKAYHTVYNKRKR
jgi:hypothetical protein